MSGIIPIIPFSVPMPGNRLSRKHEVINPIKKKTLEEPALSIIKRAKAKRNANDIIKPMPRNAINELRSIGVLSPSLF